MGYAEGDPFPCTGFESTGAVLRLNEDGTPQGNDTALIASACCADWYLGPGKWIWRDGDPDAPPAPPEPEPEPEPAPPADPPPAEPDPAPADPADQPTS